MAQVSLQINGYGYVLACGDGEEDHLLALAADLDRRIDDIKATTGPSGEARMLLMAALMIGDELHDLRRQTGSTAPAAKSGAKLGKRLRSITRKAEAIADSAATPPSHGLALDGTAQRDTTQSDTTRNGTADGDAAQSRAGRSDATPGAAGHGDAGHDSSGQGGSGDFGHDNSGQDGFGRGDAAPGDVGHGDVGRGTSGHGDSGPVDLRASQAPDQVVEPSEHH